MPFVVVYGGYPCSSIKGSSRWLKSRASTKKMLIKEGPIHCDQQAVRMGMHQACLPHKHLVQAYFHVSAGESR
ncbi:MAG: hypothetical protein RBQ88_02415 [Desulfobulbus oligotrophicus]|nr:hypothetical protein [Desulfobulbus oligotrophicus]